MARVNFIRMNGLGNDFLIYDARKQGGLPQLKLPANIKRLASRNNEETRGCDQLIIIEESPQCDAFMLVYNADGSEVYACGNASRCVASLLSKEIGKPIIKLETKAGMLYCDCVDEINVSVDMGEPIFDWKKIPLAKEVDFKNLPVDIGGFSKPFAVSMGNPHMVFTTDKEVDDIDVVNIATPLEKHPLYPQRTNVGFAQVVNRNKINLRVFERGAGETLACGTGACAAVVAAISRDLCDRDVVVNTRGGKMHIKWFEENGHVVMTGPAILERTVLVEV